MSNNNPTLQHFQVSEIRVSYIPKILMKDKPKVSHSRDCYALFLSYWDMETIAYEEQVCVMYLNRSNRVKGIHRHSIGSMSGSVVDVKQILGIALKSNASSLILCHNHPSGNLMPSQADIELTKKVKKAAKILDLMLLDHLIISTEGYYSFADEVML